MVKWRNTADDAHVDDCFEHIGSLFPIYTFHRCMNLCLGCALLVVLSGVVMRCWGEVKRLLAVESGFLTAVWFISRWAL